MLGAVGGSIDDFLLLRVGVAYLSSFSLLPLTVPPRRLILLIVSKSNELSALSFWEDFLSNQ